MSKFSASLASAISELQSLRFLVDNYGHYEAKRSFSRIPDSWIVGLNLVSASPFKGDVEAADLTHSASCTMTRRGIIAVTCSGRSLKIGRDSIMIDFKDSTKLLEDSQVWLATLEEICLEHGVDISINYTNAQTEYLFDIQEELSLASR